MSMVYTEEQAQELEEAGFLRSTPERSFSSEYEQRRTLTHYGCSPALDIDVRDRNVLPPDKGLIRACQLVQFVGVRVPVERASGEAAPPDYDPSNLYRGPADAKPVPQKIKQPGDCAQEMSYAYADVNPWGFQVFTGLTGMEPDDAYAIFRSVLPHRMNLPELTAHLDSLGEMDDETAESVRLQLLNGCQDAANFAGETLEASASERASGRAGRSGKTKFDNRDKKLAKALGVRLPDDTMLPAAPVQAQAASDPATLDAALKAAEEKGRLQAELEHATKARPASRRTRSK